jgi:hypothetical protein
MAVRVFCQNPTQLLQKIKREASNGSLETWTLDADGDFTHSPDQWRNRAWLRPHLEEDRIVFNILAPVGSRMSRPVYAVYHGRFIEMLLGHFDLEFSRATATALPITGDNIGNDRK